MASTSPLGRVGRWVRFQPGATFFGRRATPWRHPRRSPAGREDRPARSAPNKEANCNPFAVSGAGAKGLAQFTPGTARAYGLDDPFDGEASIDAQAHLMHDLLTKYKTAALALAAYNAGAGAVDRYHGIPPFAETQGYVTRVLGLMSGAGAIAGGFLAIRLVA